MTNKQIELVERLVKEMGIEVNMEEVRAYETRQASSFIEALIAKRNKMNEGRPSERQLEMLKDMIRCPFLSDLYEKELARVPQRWIEEKGRLEDEYASCLKLLDKPETSSKLWTIEDLDDLLDKMCEAEMISVEMYAQVFEIPNRDMQEARIIQIAECNDLEVKGHTVIKVEKLDKATVRKLEMQKIKLANRIAKANQCIEDMKENFDMKKLDRTTVAEWIETNRPTYVAWQDERLTRSQFDFIKELQERLARISGAKQTMTEDGVVVTNKKGNYHEFHKCVLLSDDAIKCFTKRYAEQYIHQLEKELNDKTLGSIPKEPIRETQIEARRAGMYRDKSDEVQNVVRHLYATIGQEADDVEGLTEEEVRDIVKFVFTIQGADRSARNMVVEICKPAFTESEVFKMLV